MDGDDVAPSAREEMAGAGEAKTAKTTADQSSAPPDHGGRILRSGRVSAFDPNAASDLIDTLGSGLATALFFVSPRCDFDQFVQSASRSMGDTPFLACTTAGEIADGYHEDEIVGVGLPEAEFATASVVIPDLDHLDPEVVIAGMIRARNKLAAQHSVFENEFAFLMVDGTSLKEDQLMEVISRGLGPVPLFGGSAGDGTRFHRSLICANDTVMGNAAVLLFVRTACPVKVFSFDHLEPRAERMVVTRADPENRIVQQINAEPAAREYARILGKDPEQLDPFTFASHPVVVRIGGRFHVRSIQRVNDAGELVFFSAIDEGVVLTLASPGDMASQLERDLTALSEGGTLDSILACDCILRRIEATQKQSRRAVSHVLAKHHVVGFSTYGEQFGAMHVNLTMTGVALFRPDDSS